jgi:hypothetical protein
MLKIMVFTPAFMESILGVLIGTLENAKTELRLFAILLVSDGVGIGVVAQCCTGQKNKNY